MRAAVSRRLGRVVNLFPDPREIARRLRPAGSVYVDEGEEKRAEKRGQNEAKTGEARAVGRVESVSFSRNENHGPAAGNILPRGTVAYLRVAMSSVKRAL